MKCCVLGSGTWGSALAQVLSDNSNEVIIYGRDVEEVSDINNNHQNKKYFGDKINLSSAIKATTDIALAIKDSTIIVVAVPSIAYREVLLKIKPYIRNKPYIVSVAKGFDPTTLKRMSDVVREIIPSDMRQEVVSLIGPGHAEEVIVRKLTCITSTCVDLETAKYIQHIFSNNYLRVYAQVDEIGAEYGAAIKNTIAIAAGILQGLGMGDNAKAALVTRGLIEMIKLGTFFGGKEKTFLGLTGIGDLMVTCNSYFSRNFQAGLAIGKANSAKEFLLNNTKTVEGIRTTEILYKIGKEENIELPIVNAIYDVLYQDVKPRDALDNLMKRKLKSE